MKNIWSRLLLLFACISGLLSFIPPIITGYFFFTFDGARDFLWVKNQVDFLKPSLVGPWGSIAGVFFGPLWFWILSVPYILGRGDPRIITLFSGLLVFFTGILAYFLLKKHSYPLAFFTLLLGMISPGILSLSEFAFSQHLLLPLTFLLVYSLANIVSVYQRKYLFLALLSLSLMFHAEPSTAIFSIPSLIIISILSPHRKKYFQISNIIAGCIVFMVPFLPQIVFDLRHSFIQTKALIEYFRGNNQTMLGALPLNLKIADRIMKFFDTFRFATFYNNILISFMLLVVIVTVNMKFLRDKFPQNLWKASIIYITTLFISFMYFKPELKGFYLEGTIIVYILSLALALSALWQKKKFQIPIVVFLVILILINTKPYNIINGLKSSFGGRNTITGAYKNQLTIVDWIYQNAHGRGFKVYTYDPAIYDYSYQYIFLWYGPKKYSYLPADFSYLPGVPEYVQFKTDQLARLSTKIKPADNLVYLMIQKEDKKVLLDGWLLNFPENKFKLVKREVFPDKTIVEQRQLLSLPKTRPNVK